MTTQHEGNASMEASANVKKLASYEPTTRERSALEAHFDRRRRRKPAPRMRVSMEKDTAIISSEHADEAVETRSLWRRSEPPM
jgi:hypothetical protein